VAKKQRGSLTVVQAADALGITLQEAEASLDTMTRRGYVVQTVYENGSVAYEFPGFLPGSNDLK
jgi:predicted ArsR family transcriptional regulator